MGSTADPSRLKLLPLGGNMTNPHDFLKTNDDEPVEIDWDEVTEEMPVYDDDEATEEVPTLTEEEIRQKLIEQARSTNEFMQLDQEASSGA